MCYIRFILYWQVDLTAAQRPESKNAYPAPSRGNDEMDPLVNLAPEMLCSHVEREREDDNLKRLGGEDFITGRGGDGVAILLQIKLSGSRRKFYAKARHDMRRAS